MSRGRCFLTLILASTCFFPRFLGEELCAEGDATTDVVELLQTAQTLHRNRQAPAAAVALEETGADVQKALLHLRGGQIRPQVDPVTGETVQIPPNVDPATGEPCSLCNYPYPERVAPGVNYTLRTDCGSSNIAKPENMLNMFKPLFQTFSKPAGNGRPATNAWCELNAQKVCADGIYNKDFLYQAKAVKYPHSQSYDLWYCNYNGWLDPEMRKLQNDFSGMDQFQRDQCNSNKYLKYGWNTTMTLAEMALVYLKGMTRHPSYPTPEEALFVGAWTCAMGNAGCDMSYCAYSFCKLKVADGGTPVFGMYGDCPGWDPVKGMPVNVDDLIADDTKTPIYA